MTILALRVEAPIVSFRNPHAREFGETFAYPPPSTVYGMLLSAVGEEHRARHAGVRLAVARLGVPETSTVLRTVWRVKRADIPLGTGENRRMDFQQLLTGLRIAVWVDSTGEVAGGQTLVERLARALDEPSVVERYGGLSLGESRDLVDVFARLHPAAGERGDWLVPDAAGAVALPLWPDHVAGAGTAWGRFRIELRPLAEDAPAEALITIAPPARSSSEVRHATSR